MIYSLSIGQVSRMKPLAELINTEDPGWNLVREWLGEAKNIVEVLPGDTQCSDSALYKAQVTTRSPMGAVIYETGGILIDSGWIRILGSGCARLDRSLMDWNEGKSFKKTGEQPTFLLIADDVVGGFFAINGGGLSKDNIGKVFYLSPDNLQWELLDLSYSEFLRFCFSGDINGFYEGLRWDTWKADIKEVDGSKGISCFPFLFTKEGKDINKVSRKVVPIRELWEFYTDRLDQTGKQ